MELFCVVSVHKISLQKSKLFVLRNVNFHRATEYGNFLNIGITSDLGKYLGVPLLHKKKVNSLYSPLISKVHKKLTSWKGRLLSMAGRTVLIKSVLSSLPLYQMQTVLIPRGVLKEIEKLSRSFLWNQGEACHKLHLIAWDTIKRDKKHGGLGIKDLIHQNEAFIMKLCWGLINNPNALWVRCLKSKYECGEGKIPKVEKRRDQSAVWSAITSIWDKFMKGIGSRIGNGASTRAWWDLWTPLPLPLIQYVDRNQDFLDPRNHVNQFVTQSGEWDLRKWRSFLPQGVVDKIKEIQPPSQRGEDQVWWRASSDGNFSVKSAYDLIAGEAIIQHDNIWQRLWKGQLPERAKFFM